MRTPAAEFHRVAKAFFEESKESNYETLDDSSRGWHETSHDSAPWLDYFWGALLRAYKEFEERVGTIERGRGPRRVRLTRQQAAGEWNRKSGSLRLT